MITVAPERPHAIPARDRLLAPPAGALEVLATRPDPAESMRITITQLQRVASRMHSAPTSQDGQMHTRIRYLVKSGFPRAFAVSKGGTTVLELDDALRLLLAVEMLSFGVANSTAVASLGGDGWMPVGRTLYAAWPRRDGQREAGRADALIARGGFEAEDSGDGQRLSFDPISTLAYDLTDEGARTSRSVLIVDVVGILRRLAEAIPELLVGTPKQLDEGMRALAAETFGTADEARWSTPAVAERATA